MSSTPRSNLPSTATDGPTKRSASSTRTVLVTGGAKRVGRATCRAFASAGFDVVLTYRTSKDEAELAQRELVKFNVNCSIYPLDLYNPNEVSRFAQQIATDLPRLDVLVHNASMYAPSPLAELNAEDLLSHFRINALAPLLLSQRLAGRLAESSMPGGGSIVAMLDIHAMGLPRRDYAAYAMSKSALAQAVRALARELAPALRVNGVAPGVVQWPETGADSDEAMQARYLKSVPLGRAGTPEEAAEAVLWLATRATYTTGHIINIDGGRSLL